MDPKHVPVGDCLLDLRAEPAKSLLQSIAPTAAPEHLQEVIRRAYHEKQSEQNVVNALHYARPLACTGNSSPARSRLAESLITPHRPSMSGIVGGRRIYCLKKTNQT